MRTQCLVHQKHLIIIIVILLLLDHGLLDFFPFYNQKGQWEGGRGCHRAGKDQICHNNTRNKFSKNRRWLLKGLRP